jgi:SAM-dependent methyltransferase
MQRFGRLFRGVFTVARRRGVGYFSYLIREVTVQRALYRFFWGPAAPRVARRLFQAMAGIAGRVPADEQLQACGLLVERSDTAVAAVVTSADVERLMERAHRAGVTGVSSAFDRVREADGYVRFEALPGARLFRRGSAHYLAGRDADRVAFNRRFGADLMTEEQARASLRAIKAQLPGSYRDYAPIDYGRGLAIGQIASTDSGTGRWEYCNEPVVAPIVAGKRVLDLGCNNASLSLMMLRAGAREVVGVEMSPEIAEFARLNARILAWRDMRPYELTVLTGDMRRFLWEDLGPFDVITAFCSLYYLPERDMEAVIRKAARLGATLILQANEAIGNNRPGRMRDLQRLMVENGYPATQVYAPAGFSRPMLVGPAEEGTSVRVA